MTYEEKVKLHDQEVQNNVEKAKDPSGYCTYLSEISGFDKEISVYSARKIGRSHVKSGKPCQDYCMTQAVSKGHIFTISDGVSACLRSDKGAQFACEAAIEAVREADSATTGEKDFVAALCGLQFRKTLVNKWIGMINKDVAEIDEKPFASFADLELYGATLSMAVITENRIVTLNLGDGQILLFNPSDAMRVRWHAPKSDSATSALCIPTCYEDSFIVHEHDRNAYSGIVLSTDGMYDNLANYSSFYAYARQILERFEASKEPLQPFCYLEKTPQRTRWIDLHTNMTQDDCSIILVVDHRPLPSHILELSEALNKTYKITELNTRSGDLSLYKLTKDDKAYLALARHGSSEEAKQARKTAEGLKLKAGKVLKPVRQWEEAESTVALYNSTTFATPLEFFILGKLLEKREVKYGLNASKTAYLAYQMLSHCDKELREQGYCLNDNARFLSWLTNDGLALMPEAISPLEKAGEVKLLWQLFDNQLGSLTCRNEEGKSLTRPLFSCGFNLTGHYLLNPFLPDQEKLCYLQRGANNLRTLVNSGKRVWKLKDGTEVASGKSVELTDGLTFTIPGENQSDTITVTFCERKDNT